MPEPFDPYQSWLGIPPHEQPPHAYRLLGVRPFEGDSRVLQHGLNRIRLHLQPLQSGPYAAVYQQILAEVNFAGQTLLDPQRKAAYDLQLSSQLNSGGARRPIPVSTPMPVAATASEAAPFAGVQEAAPAISLQTPSGGTDRGPARGSRGKGGDDIAQGAMSIVQVVVGGAGGLAIAILLLWIALGSDPFGLFQPAAPPVAQNKPKKPKQPVVDPVTRPAVNPSAKSAVAVPSQPADVVQPPPPASTDPASPALGPNSSGSTPSTTESPVSGGGSPTVPQPANPVPSTPPDNGFMPGGARPPSPATPSPKKNPIPTKEQQEAKQAQLTEIYRSEYDNAAKNRLTFPARLMEIATSVKDDPAARYVLYVDSYKRRLEIKDFSGCAVVIDRLEAEFEIDPYVYRLSFFNAMKKEVRLPAQRALAVSAASEMAEAAIQAGRAVEGPEFARIAENLSKSLPDKTIGIKLSARAREIEKLAGGLGGLKNAKDLLAANPADPNANLLYGKHLCLLEGDWPGGLVALAKAVDPQLSAAARADLAGPSATVTELTLADTWYEIGQREQGFLLRAEYWYDRAAKNVSGLDKVKADAQLAKIVALNLPRPAAARQQALPSLAALLGGESSSGGPAGVNIFDQMTKTARAGARGWSPGTSCVAFSDGASSFALMPSSTAPTTEAYEVNVKVRRRDRTTGRGSSQGALAIGLIGPSGPFMAVIDSKDPVSYSTRPVYLTTAGVSSPRDSAGFTSSPQLIDDEDSYTTTFRVVEISCLVDRTRNEVELLVDGRTRMRYSGDLKRLGMGGSGATLAVGGGNLFLASLGGTFYIESWELRPYNPETRPDPQLAPPPQFAPPPRFNNNVPNGRPLITDPVNP